MLEKGKPGTTRNVHADMMGLTLEIVAQTLFSAAVGDNACEAFALDTLMKYWAGPGAAPWWKYGPTPGQIRFRRGCGSSMTSSWKPSRNGGLEGSGRRIRCPAS